ncbi:thermonuclease family protein [uncultured Arthrobacter sp.]|uniref:thermonuclease family protein n=1 Tax=uncultured Arthrobacter sp. TaxID=114050 RepID=UPI0026257464|nr:thermonuclease family protein [uncultured Arthrobacter sp.]
MFTPVIRKWCALGVAIGALSVTACSPSADATTGQVVRVVDGDTVIVKISDVDTTVRLLNIDTPETKHPDKAVECFGPEATAFLAETLPAGTEVGLDFDVEREDQYGRTLAALFLEDRTLVNAEIARQGLGSAVIFEPNEKYYDAVKAAQEEAQQAELGVFSVDAECTLPSEVTAAVDSLAAVLEQPVASTSGAAAAGAAAVAGALATAEGLRAALEAGEDSIRWAALGTAGTAALSARLGNSIDSGRGALAELEQEATLLKAAEDKAAKEAAAAAKRETERVAAEAEARRIAAEAEARVAAEAEAARRAAEAAAAAEAERIRNLPAPAPAPYVPPAPAPAPYVPPAPAPAPYVPPAPAPAPPAEQNPYPGYNGPRCYAPGGKTWKPCP